MFHEGIELAKKQTLQSLKVAPMGPLKSFYENLLLKQEKLLLESPPTRQEEDWKYADLKFIQNNSYSILDTASGVNHVSYDADLDVIRVTVSSTAVGAKWTFAGEIPAGFNILSRDQFSIFKNTKLVEQVLGAKWTYSNYFLRLNQGLNSANFFIVFSKEFSGSSRVEIEYKLPAPVTEGPSWLNSQIVVVLEAQIAATILEKMYLNDNCFFNSSVDYYLSDYSQLSLLKIEKGAPTGKGCHTSRFSVLKGAHLFATTATIGSSWSRHNVYAQLSDEGAQADILATYLAEKKQFVDHHTYIEHKIGNTTSVQKYTGVLSDQAKAVFNGQVKIDRHAQKSSAVQINRNLLLSKTAEINTKPELQIDADDVQAKHGATVGQIRPEELFYLQSRGISESIARSMLVRGFIEEIGLLQPAKLKSIFFQEVGEFLTKVSGAE